MQSKDSILCLQEATTGPYTKPNETNSQPPIQNTVRLILILSSHLCLGFPIGFFSSDFPTQFLYVLHSSPILRSVAELAHVTCISGALLANML